MVTITIGDLYNGKFEELKLLKNDYPQILESKNHYHVTDNIFSINLILEKGTIEADHLFTELNLENYILKLILEHIHPEIFSDVFNKRLTKSFNDGVQMGKRLKIEEIKKVLDIGVIDE